MNNAAELADRAWVLIPAYQPSVVLEDVVSALIAGGFDRILIVNDGSAASCTPIFKNLAGNEKITVLHHAVNMGKGAALKTGINFFLLNAANGVPGLITADADGQHLPEDILRVADRANERPDKLLIGARQFDSAHPVPLRSRLGNVLTRNIFGLLAGRKLSDTQTGLRYLPRPFLEDCLKIGSNGYEFELEMLFRAIAQKRAIGEVSIKTVYFGNNEHSHFNPLLDSLKIYYVFARFLSASMATALIDYIVFIGFHWFTGNILVSLVAARFFAGSFNFLLARNWVFHSRKRTGLELPAYVLTVAVVTMLSFGGINLLSHSLGWSVLASKLVTEGIMFSVSFLAMRLLVFREAEEPQPRKTDWDAYYRRPAPTAKITRKFTERLILKYFRKYATIQNPSIAELGGARSCFFPAIRETFPDGCYTVIDNNDFGLAAFKKTFPDARNVTLINADVEHPLNVAPFHDITFSVGLIEHFDAVGTAKAITRHFEVTKNNGLVLITFPTPTWLYCGTRKLLEWIGVWSFPDERPLGFEEVRNQISVHGKILHESINWWVILTQGVIVASRSGAEAASVASPGVPDGIHAAFAASSVDSVR